jgi:hypothetical protein
VSTGGTSATRHSGSRASTQPYDPPRCPGAGQRQDHRRHRQPRGHEQAQEDQGGRADAAARGRRGCGRAPSGRRRRTRCPGRTCRAGRGRRRRARRRTPSGAEVGQQRPPAQRTGEQAGQDGDALPPARRADRPGGGAGLRPWSRRARTSRTTARTRKAARSAGPSARAGRRTERSLRGPRPPGRLA